MKTIDNIMVNRWKKCCQYVKTPYKKYQTKDKKNPIPKNTQREKKLALDEVFTVMMLILSKEKEKRKQHLSLEKGCDVLLDNFSLDNWGFLTTKIFLNGFSVSNIITFLILDCSSMIRIMIQFIAKTLQYPTGIKK